MKPLRITTSRRTCRKTRERNILSDCVGKGNSKRQGGGHIITFFETYAFDFKMYKYFFNEYTFDTLRKELKMIHIEKIPSSTQTGKRVVPMSNNGTVPFTETVTSIEDDGTYIHINKGTICNKRNISFEKKNIYTSKQIDMHGQQAANEIFESINDSISSISFYVGNDVYVFNTISKQLTHWDYKTKQICEKSSTVISIDKNDTTIKIAYTSESSSTSSVCLKEKVSFNRTTEDSDIIFHFIKDNISRISFFVEDDQYVFETANQRLTHWDEDGKWTQFTVKSIKKGNPLIIIMDNDDRPHTFRTSLMNFDTDGISFTKSDSDSDIIYQFIQNTLAENAKKAKAKKKTLDKWDNDRKLKIKQNRQNRQTLRLNETSDWATMSSNVDTPPTAPPAPAPFNFNGSTVNRRSIYPIAESDDEEAADEEEAMADTGFNAKNAEEKARMEEATLRAKPPAPAPSIQESK